MKFYMIVVHDVEDAGQLLFPGTTFQAALAGVAEHAAASMDEAVKEDLPEDASTDDIIDFYFEEQAARGGEWWEMRKLNMAGDIADWIKENS
jgi:hypothetical protein